MKMDIAKIVDQIIICVIQRADTALGKRLGGRQDKRDCQDIRRNQNVQRNWSGRES